MRPDPDRSSSALAAAFALALALVLPGNAARAEGPAVLELFTSQSCYSCPPAEALLGELVQRDGLIALEFHVDYWDDLVYGAAGQWKDVFSDPAYTRRQHRYARTIPGSQSYTPQVVVDGSAQTVGSRSGSVRRLVERAAAGKKPARVTVRPRAGGGLAVTVAAAERAAEAEVLLARYDVRRVTEVKAGENKGKTLVNHHVVRELRALGGWSGAHAEFELPDPGLRPGQGCAVIVQTVGQGPILGAAACPSRQG